MMSMLKRRTEFQAKHFVTANFEAYQDGALTEADTAFYRQHLAACQECRDWESRQVRLVEQFGIEMSPPARLSPAAADRIHQNIYRRMRRANLMNNLKATFGAVAAIAIIAIAVGSFIWWRSGEIDLTSETTDLDQESLAPEPFGQDSLNELLIEAVNLSDPVKVERLLNEGADPDIIDTFNNPILKSSVLGAVIRGNSDIVRLLIESGADVNAPDNRGDAILPSAAQMGQLEIVQLMLDAGADVNGTMIFGKDNSEGTEDSSALMQAAAANHLEIVELLIARGADVNYAETTYNRTALHGSAWENNADIVKILIENGADINPHSTWFGGETPLHFAARNGSAEAVQVLIDAGADLDVQTEVGRTSLMSVLNWGSPSNVAEIVTLLLVGGADSNLQDRDGDTALHYASRKGRVDVLPILIELIEHGAALDLKNNKDETAVDVAATEEIAEILRAAGAEE